MRTGIIISLLLAVSAAIIVGCNSQESSTTSTPRKVVEPPPPGQSPQTVQNPADTARRISADDLHKLWQNNEVLVIDTRNEAAFEQSHIKGAILIPANDFAARADELPKNKTIVTYCT